ncbi:MAG: extracellular solute-binding protein, partial [Gammaproteobacteria bacterium]|nr:extracellular solute-binding protein [Gammaproteobacteria bacterium]NDG43273.1 extracellular solute-binding protein [Gammaproteobacteria bacterium]
PAQADVTVVSWGGAYTMSQQKAYSDTYAPGGINWVNYNGGLGEVRAQVESGNVTWDIVDVLPHEARVGCDEGLFEELPRDVFTKAPDGTSMDDDMFVPIPNDCVVPQIFWSYVPFYQKGTFDGNAAGNPKTIADFFDVKKFPGKRGIHTWANATVEMALMADGVAPGDVYKTLSTKAGQDRAFAKLDTIKDHVVFWSAGAEPLELVKSGEVAMSLAYNGRIGAAVLSENAPFVTNWDGQVLEEEWLVLVKGSPNRDEALKFLIHASAPEQQAGQAKWITYAPMRKSGIDIIAKSEQAGKPWFNTGVNILPLMPNAGEATSQKHLYADPVWWADNGDSISERFKAWMGQ